MMKRRLVLGLALATVMIGASTAVEAQLGGLLKKKAGEVLSKKPETPATPAPAPAAAPAPTPSPATATPAPAAPATTARGDARAAEKTTGSPLEVSALPVRRAANEVLRNGGEARSNGDWSQLPYIPTAATTAAYALGDSARVALVETVGAALKTLVMSAPFVSEHDAYIKTEHQAVDHGLKGVIGMDEAMKKNDLKAIEAIQAREVVAMGVFQVRNVPPDYLKKEFLDALPKWKEQAANPKLRDRAKYQKMVARAQSIELLPASDEKFLRGYAVIKSIDNDGPDTEDAVFAISQRVSDEKEQSAYDTFNLKGQLKQQLTAFVAIASKVNFDAPTAQKSGTTKFVNAADERQGALWKACFRAGQAPTAAAVKLAKAWLAEM